MKRLLDFKAFEAETAIKDETFSVYHGRYLFDVTKAHEMIRDGELKYRIREYPIEHLKLLQKSFLTLTHSKKVKSLQMDYDKPLAIVVCAYDPELKTREWFMIDGNHRVARAYRDGVKKCKVWEVTDPNETAKFFTVDTSKKKTLFADED